MKYFFPIILFLCGCAAITDGTLESAETITFTSIPSEAVVTTNGVRLCVTPCRVRVYRGSISSLTVQKDGYQSVRVDANKSSNIGIFGNIIFGGGVGVALDVLSGRVVVFADAVHVELEALNM
jgi:hypothetical protein